MASSSTGGSERPSQEWPAEEEQAQTAARSGKKKKKRSSESQEWAEPEESEKSKQKKQYQKMYLDPGKLAQIMNWDSDDWYWWFWANRDLMCCICCVCLPACLCHNIGAGNPDNPCTVVSFAKGRGWHRSTKAQYWYCPGCLCQVMMGEIQGIGAWKPDAIIQLHEDMVNHRKAGCAVCSTPGKKFKVPWLRLAYLDDAPQQASDQEPVRLEIVAQGVVPAGPLPSNPDVPRSAAAPVTRSSSSSEDESSWAIPKKEEDESREDPMETDAGAAQADPKLVLHESPSSRMSFHINALWQLWQTMAQGQAASMPRESEAAGGFVMVEHGVEASGYSAAEFELGRNLDKVIMEARAKGLEYTGYPDSAFKVFFQ